MPPLRRLAAVLAFALLLAAARAQVPQLINYQGRVVVDGVNFDSTAAGHAGVFRFALVNADGSQTYWSNDGTSAAGSEPAAGVALAVHSGLYAVALGDSAPPLGMAPVSHTVFANADVRLRVWFDDGAHGSQLLTPDQRIAAVGYALVARSVADGAVTAEKIAPGAVDSTKLAVGAVQSAHLAAGAVGNAQLANAAVTVTAGEGLDGGGTVALGGAITLNNTGVTRLAAGGGITLSGSTGAITLGSNATALSTPGTLVMRTANGDFAAGTITANLLGNAATATSAGSALTATTAGSALTATTAGSALTALMANDFSGLLAGDVTGPQGVTSVGFVGGISAANVAAGALLANAATPLASPGTLVLRDLNGDFAAGTITANLLGNAATATTAVSFSGPLAGDVGGTQGAVVVTKIGGVTPSSASVPGAVVRRDASGNFSAGTVSASAFSGSGAGLTGVPGTLPWQTITGTAQLAEPNTGYLATAATAVTVTLPATAAAGDLVRVTGAGAGGWAIVPGAGQSIAGFGAGLGPVGAPGAGGAVQYVGAGQWQPLNESQLAAGAVQSSHLAAGAVDSTKLAAGAVQNASIAAGTIANAKLANPTFSVNAGAGLAGGGSAALGGALALSIPNGGIANAQLANSAITLNTGAGLAGGGPVVLGGALSLSIPVAGITSAQLAPNAVTGANITAGAVNGTHLAPGAAMANITNSGQDLAAIADLVSNPSAAQWLGASALPTFMGARLVNTGTGANKPALVLDRGIAPKGRVTFQKTNEEPGWSGLVLSINADWNDQTGYAYDDGGRSQSVMQLEYEWLAPGGFRQNEFNWTSSGRRIWAHHCRVDDNTKAGVAFLASLVVSVPANDTTGGPALQVEGYKGAGDAVAAIVQNDNPTAAASSQLILRGISTGADHFPVAWALATDRAGSGTNNFAISDGVAGVDRLFIDPAGKVGINNVTPQAQLDVTGAVHVSGAVQAGGPVDATGFTVNGAPLQSVKHSLEFGGGQVQGMGNSRGSGFLWRAPVILSAAFSPFGGSSEDRGPFVPQPKAEYSYGCIVLPRTWANGIQIRVRTWYCLKPGDTADAAPGNVVLLMQGVWGRSTPLNSISQPVASWELTSAGSGLQPLAFAGGIDGELIFDERTYTIPAGADLTSRQIRFGRFGGSAGDTEPKDLYFFGITVEQL